MRTPVSCSSFPHHSSLSLVSSTARRAAALSLIVGIATTVLVATNDLLPGEVELLRWVLRWLEPVLGPVSDVLDDSFTDTSASVVFVVLVPVVWWWRGHWGAVVFLVAGAATSLARLGNLVDRPRPSGSLSWSDSAPGPGGYPSGHVVYFVLVFGTVALLAASPADRPGHREHPAVSWLAGAAIVVVGPARLVALDHWPLDVVGAYVLAFPVLVALGHLWTCGPTWRRRRGDRFTESAGRLRVVRQPNGSAAPSPDPGRRG